MNYKAIKDEIQNIIYGKSGNSQKTLIRTVADYLRASERTSTLVKKDKQYKQKETKKLIEFCNQNNLWVNEKVNFDLFVSEGAEQKVYIKNNKTVFKLNDAIYYESWQDYLINLQLNNYFFPDTTYTLVGFCLIDQIIYALLEQPFVTANESTDLEKVAEFMLENGFVNTRNHDYFNSELGIILEDLHDENVLTKDGVLYFIDTVFYLKS
jgi:Serine/Threonine/Tyrosine Kinase found in polyvalent proteins